MGRWQPDSRGRLERTALALYAERGFHNTTVSEIAERTGLSERTFFRHFADKREVLFHGTDALQDVVLNVVANVPKSVAAIAVVGAALAAIGARLQQWPQARQRQEIIGANPELRERELIKLALLASALAEALRQRGVEKPTASMAGEAGIVAFRVALSRWIDDTEGSDLTGLIRDSLDDLRAVMAGK